MALKLAFTGILGVFLGLVLLLGFLFLTQALFEYRTKLSFRRSSKEEKGKTEEEDVILSGEQVAAIAAILYLDVCSFDEQEKNLLTIHKVTKPYSPWFNSGKMNMIMNNLKIFNKNNRSF